MSELDTETVEEVLSIVPDRPLASLYDIACLYAACDVYDRYTSEYVEWDVSPEALRAMSPGKVEQLTDPEQEHSLIAAQIDLSGDPPELGDPAVVVENLTDELKYKIGFMSRKKTSSQTDYSISNSSFSGDDVETLAHDTWGNRFLRGRLERWPFEVSDELVEEYPLLKKLRKLGDDTDTMERLEQALLDRAEFDETEAIVTIKVRLESGGDYLYPGEVEALNAAGVRNRLEHIRDGLSVDEAHGIGVGYISGEEGEVLGGSGGIRGQYGKLQTGRFPNLVSNDAWLSRPLAEDQAAAVSSFDDFVGDFSFLQHGVRLHYLPYPMDRIDVALFKRFYSEVYSSLRSTDEADFADRLIEIYTSGVNGDAGNDVPDSPLGDLIDDAGEYEPFTQDGGWLRLYALMYVGSTDPSRVFVDEPNVSLESITSLEDAYLDVLEDVGGSDLFGTLASSLSYYLPTEGGVAYALLFGSFFDSVTAASPDEDDTEDADAHATTGDALFNRYAKLLRGSPISLPTLMTDFATFVTRELRSNLGEAQDPFPTRAVVSQYIQLRTLDRAGLLRGDSIMTDGICNRYMRSMGDGETYSSREERLQDFLDSHPMLEDAETRSVFLLGGLVGRLSAYQYRENVSQKLTEQYPPSSINRRAIPDVTQEVLDRNYTYGDKDNINRFNRRYTDRLADSMLAKSPSEWGISESEAKWLYALGVAYGKQDTGEGIERPEDAETTDGELADADEAEDDPEQPGITEY